MYVNYDLTNQRFGSLVVIKLSDQKKDIRYKYWDCICDCGNSKVVQTKYLIHNKTKTCGHCSFVKIGQKIGSLEVLEIDTIGKYKKYKCICHNCDNLVNIRGTTKLLRSESCGCIDKNKKEEELKLIVGSKQNNLTILDLIKKNKSYHYLCKCDCGNFREVITYNLKNITSCGKCRKLKRFLPEFLWRNIFHGAKNRNLDFSITEEMAYDLYLTQKGKCNLSGRSIIISTKSNENTASLDRIDSSKGYIEGNIQWVHKDINIMKNKFPVDYFINICDDIYNKNKSSIVTTSTPSKIDYFLGIALVTSARSKDSQTKVGAVLVDENDHIISTGYNSYPKGLDDTILSNLRPEKYKYMVHAEINLLHNSTKSIFDFNGTLYITTKPCVECLKSLVNCNIKNIYAIDNEISDKTNENNDLFEYLLYKSKINYVLVKPDLSYIRNILQPYLS